MLDKLYGISDLASEFNVTTRTIRYYEEKGLLSPTRQGVQRIYTASDRTKLKLILRGKRLGLSLDESAEIVLMYGSPEKNRKQLEKLIDRIRERRVDLEKQQKELTAMLRELKAAEEKCVLAMEQSEP